MSSSFQSGEPRTVQTRASILHGLQAGDEERWREFYHLYAPVIRGFALKAGLNQTEADEVVQETCVGVARNIPEFQYDPARCRFKSWLLNLASWRVKNQFVKRQRWEHRLHHGHSENLQDRTATVERVSDPAGDVLEHLWNEEWRGNLLKAAMEKVRSRFSATQFQIFDLSIVKHWSAGEIARSLGVSRPTVYLARHRLAAALKKEMQSLEAIMARGHGR